MADFRNTVIKLNNNNYSNWKYKVRLLLMKDNLFKKVIEQERPIPDANNTKFVNEWDAADAQAQSYIGLSVEDDQLIHIRGRNTAKEMWNSLKEYHEKGTLTNKVHLMRMICTLKLDEGGDASQHINKMQELFLKLRDVGEESLSDKWSVAMLLSSLPRSYDPLITALETRPETELTFATVQQKVIAEYERRQHAEETFNNTSGRVLKSIANKDQGKSVIKCFFCKKPGHLKRSCKKYLKWKENHPDKEMKHSRNNLANSVEYKDCLFSTHFGTDNWILDSGATRHVTNSKEFFTDLDTSYNDKIQVANGELIHVSGIGSGKLLFKNPEGIVTPVKVSEVLFAPNIVGNLVSVRQLTLDNFSVNFNKNDCEIFKNGKIVGLGHAVGNLYKLWQPYDAHAAFDHKENCIHTWHRKMGHRDPEAIKKMHQEELLADFKLVECGVKMSCDVCFKGKLTRLPFPKKSTSRSTSVLDLIHTDVCGPMQTVTPGGKRYMVTFIDDYSRYTYVYLLANKSDLQHTLKHYIAQVKNKFDKKVKIIRSDRGGEYLNTQLRRYLADEGIRTQLTAAYSPQQNGVAERKNRTLMEMARCMLIDAGLPNKFWGEAVITANYIQNRTLTRAKELTPYELWNKEKPKVKNFQIFGSKCFVHVPNEKRRKLDNTGTQMIFLGYDEESKAYRCYNPFSEKVVISRDVRFSTDQRDDQDIIKAQSEGSKLQIEISSPEVKIQEEENEVNKPPSSVRISQRKTKGIPPKRLIEEINIIEEIKEPKSYNEAISSKHKENWLKAMEEEFASLEENGTWELCDLPENRKAIGSKWVYKVKKSSDGNIQQFKARLVAQGFSQKYGEDYDETFAPVVRQTTLRTLLSVAAKEKLKVNHFDIKTAFLNGKLNETIYMKQPTGFIKENASKVCFLKKSIYGLKQAARVWNEAIHKVIVNAHFEQSKADPCLYSRKSRGSCCYILIYVDDIIVAGISDDEIQEVENILSKHFKVKNLGFIQQYLGIEVNRDLEGNFELCQSKYIEKTALEFGLSDAKSVKSPIDPNYKRLESTNLLKDNAKYRKLVGCLLYISVNTRPDISASVNILAQKVSSPSVEDWTQLKRVLKYLKSTSKMKLKLNNLGAQENLFCGYADANWAEDRKTRKSNSGYIFFLNGGVVSWSSRKQTCVALSSTEAELIALSEACQEALWLQKLLKDMHQEVNYPTTIYEDNQSCLCLIKSGKYSNRTKHIDTKYFFIKDCVDKGLIECVYCPTETMIADLLTKPLSPNRHALLTEKCVNEEEC